MFYVEQEGLLAKMKGYIMQISNNLSPSFGSIQVNVSEMNREQRGKSDAVFRTLKYSDRYQPLEHQDVDIYLLPNKKHKNMIDVRYMDPYSGEFIRNNQNKIINQTLKASNMDSIGYFADHVIDTLAKIVKGVYHRPNINVRNVVDGNTTMAKINPDKFEDLSEYIEEWQDLGYTQQEAEKTVVDQYCNSYHLDNRDADF